MPSHTLARRSFIEASLDHDRGPEWGTPEADELIRKAAEESRRWLRERGFDRAGRKMKRRDAA